MTKMNEKRGPSKKSAKTVARGSQRTADDVSPSLVECIEAECALLRQRLKAGETKLALNTVEVIEELAVSIRMAESDAPQATPGMVRVKPEVFNNIAGLIGAADKHLRTMASTFALAEGASRSEHVEPPKGLAKRFNTALMQVADHARCARSELADLQDGTHYAFTCGDAQADAAAAE